MWRSTLLLSVVFSQLHCSLPQTTEDINVALDKIFGQPEDDNMTLQTSDKAGEGETKDEDDFSLKPHPDINVALDKIFGTEDDNITLQTSDKAGEGETKDEDDFSLKPHPGAKIACKREDGKEGFCVTYYQCDYDTRRVITDGSPLIDPRMDSCPTFSDVCCLPEQHNTTIKEPKVSFVSTEGCGYSNPGAKEAYHYRVTEDGINAEFGEFPWMIAVLRRTNSSSWSHEDYIGGGTLIHPSVVITSTHKILRKTHIYTAEELKCRAGEFETQTDQEFFPHQDRNVRSIVSSNGYDASYIINSMTLLFLSEPFNLKDQPHIGVACLGRLLPTPGTHCWSMGWGKNSFAENAKYVNVLKKVELPLVAKDKCESAILATGRVRPTFTVHSSLFCAGGEKDKDTCTGDGGSSLVCRVGKPEDTRYAVFGLVAWGIECGLDGVPGVYVNVPSFYTWIGQQLTKQHLENDTFTYDDINWKFGDSR